MSERGDLLTAVASTIHDYRAGEIRQPTSDHVDRWISQFNPAVQLPMLREIAHVLKKTYFTESTVKEFFNGLIIQNDLAGEIPCNFWTTAHVLNIQKNGCSQTEIRKIFGEGLKIQCGLNIDMCGAVGGAYIYLDDVLFTGGRIGEDLSSWIVSNAPQKATVHVIVIAAHRLGEWKCKERLVQVAEAARKELTFIFWAGLRVENRKAYSDSSEVLWPRSLPDREDLRIYLTEEKKFPFVPRSSSGQHNNRIFSSEEGRQLLEQELLLAGMKIRSFCQNPSIALRPLGFSPFGLGFGSMIATFRNCPNNAPLAMWWGDPYADTDHPFSKWYPLLPRKTYHQEIDFNVIVDF